MAHVTREFLRKVLAGTAGRTEAAQIATHVLSCPACRSVARGVVAEIQADMGPKRPASRPGNSLRILTEIFNLEQEDALEATLAHAEWSEMRLLTPKAQKDRAAMTKICKSWVFVSLLLRELWACRTYEDAERLAHLTTICIQGMDPSQYSEHVRMDLHVELWAELANARRKAAEWTRANQAIDRAETLRMKGSLSPWLEAFCLAVGALIKADQGFVDEAAASLERCAKIYERLEDWPAVARTLVQASNVLAETHPAEGLLLAKRALPLVSSSDPELAKLARLLQVDCLIWLDELPEAASLFGSCLQSHETGRMRIRRDFVGARLLHSFGYRKEAERMFHDVVTADLELSLFKDAFLDLLYVFGMHVREGELHKARAICEHALTQPELADFSHEQMRTVWTLLLQNVQRLAVATDLLGDVRKYVAVYWRRPADGTPPFFRFLGNPNQSG
jgi:tetratricopeptide (TPR) repeat protein